MKMMEDYKRVNIFQANSAFGAAHVGPVILVKKTVYQELLLARTWMP